MTTSNYNIFSFSQVNLSEYLSSAQGNYLFDYLSDLNAKTCVLEEEYIDKGHIIDYQKFYSRSFKDYGRITKRIHFFAKDFSTANFKNSLENNDISYLQDSYLGFVVIRPIEGSDGNPLIGRALLKTYADEENGEKRVFIRGDYDASLFGIPLSIRSLPFQAQDQGVSRCATVALWAALHPLGDSFGTPRHTPVEITEISTSLPSLSRQFPSSGLTWAQMINYVRSIGLDVEAILIKRGINPDIIPSAVKAYIEAGLPLIGALKLTKKNGSPEYHAVTITGHKCDSMGEVKELYVHDDQIGPYSRVKPDGSFKVWKNEWNDKGYNVELEKLLIPIYPKIRLPFARIYPRYLEIKDRINNNFGDELDLELYLTTITKYKAFLLESTLKGKRKVLIKSLPRFLWVLRSYSDGKPLKDIVFDGTSIYPKPLTSIDFRI